MVFNVLQIGCAVAWAAVFLYKFVHLRGDWRNATLWAICLAILFPMVTTMLAPPVVQSWLNRTIGVPNVAQPIVAAGAALSAGAWLALAVLWRHPLAEAWSRLRWIITACVTDIAAMAVLFGISDVPEEHLHQHFAIHYVPEQLTIFVYQLLFLGPVTVGMSVLSFWCLAWARKDDYASLPWLRRGLFLYGLTGALLAMYFAVQILAVVAMRSGTHALDTAATVILLIVTALAIPLFPAALIVPSLGPRWPAVRGWLGRWRAFRDLRPLHRALRHVDPAIVMVARERRLDPHHRVRRMVMELSDWRWPLTPLFDPALGESVARSGARAGLTGDELKAAVEAAQLRAASAEWVRGSKPRDGGGGRGGGVGPAGSLPLDAPGPPADADIRDGTGVDEEISWWVSVARAFREQTADTPTRRG